MLNKISLKIITLVVLLMFVFEIVNSQNTSFFSWYFWNFIQGPIVNKQKQSLGNDPAKLKEFIENNNRIIQESNAALGQASQKTQGNLNKIKNIEEKVGVIGKEGEDLKKNLEKFYKDLDKPPLTPEEEKLQQNGTPISQNQEKDEGKGIKVVDKPKVMFACDENGKKCKKKVIVAKVDDLSTLIPEKELQVFNLNEIGDIGFEKKTIQKPGSMSKIGKPTTYASKVRIGENGLEAVGEIIYAAANTKKENPGQNLDFI